MANFFLHCNEFTAPTGSLSPDEEYGHLFKALSHPAMPNLSLWHINLSFILLYQIQSHGKF